ncbi:hypothetical protein SGUI_0903 [Serinicoccus hydrothermalis]|uniref:Uncharacterized protein n=1 Tax=Serinicoccus hydrothermalis TaxID=1758689 RepID=A0A1B1NA44_9MICO|nr:hypothetical protein SGUI_0903 [Serinicoccus hydrothermalis]
MALESQAGDELTAAEVGPSRLGDVERVGELVDLRDLVPGARVGISKCMPSAQGWYPPVDN